MQAKIPNPSLSDAHESDAPEYGALDDAFPHADQQRPDPLEELARIMKEGDGQGGQAVTHTPSDDGVAPGAETASRHAAAPDHANDPLQLGLGEDGLEELFRAQNFADDEDLHAPLDAHDPYDPLNEEALYQASLQASLADDALAPEPVAREEVRDDALTGGTSDDALFHDLDFSADHDETPAAPMPQVAEAPLQAVEPAPHRSTDALDCEDADQSAQHLDDWADEPVAQPTLTDHLTPRRAANDATAPVEPLDAPQTAPEPAFAATDRRSEVSDEDLLAAMETLAVDGPDSRQDTYPQDPHQAAHQDAYPGSHADLADVHAVPTPDQPASDHVASAGAAVLPFGRGKADEAAAQQLPFGDNDDDLDDDFADTAPGGSKAGRLAVFGLAFLAVLGLGGVFAAGLLSSDQGTGAPELIVADAGDDKVEPAAPDAVPSRPGDAVFSALDDGVSAGAGEPRVVLPAPSSDGLPLQSDARLPSVDIAPAPPGSTASRAVRTVTVRADGTIVESTSGPIVEVPAVPLPAAQLPQAVVDALETQPAAIDTPATGPGSVSGDVTASPRSVETVAITTPPSLPAPSANNPLIGADAANPAPPTPVVPPRSDSPQPVLPQQQAPLATPAQPIQLAAPEPVQSAAAPATPAASVAPAATLQTPAAEPALPASVPAGDFIIQLASLRSEDEARATFSRLQDRFGSILGGFSPNIQRADLGDRGVFHRVRIGPMDRAAADGLCQRYQSAGGDCFVQRQ